MPLPNNTDFCTAHKRDGSLCTNVVVRGKTKCRMHGGKSLSGLASPNYRTGRYSKHLPAQLAQRAEEARTNPRLLSLEDDIALLEARLAQLLEQVDTGESGARWQALREAMEAFSVAQAGGDMAAMEAQWRRMRQVVHEGAAAADVWAEVVKVLAERRGQIQTQVKTLQGLQQMVTTQQVTLMLGAVMQALVEATRQYADQASGRAILTYVGDEMTRLATLEER
jgi:hypothetical protein